MVEGSVAENRYSPAVPLMLNRMILAVVKLGTEKLVGYMVTGFVNWRGDPAAAVVCRVKEMGTAAVG